MSGRRSVVVFNRLPVLDCCCLLGIPLQHEAVADVHVARVVHVIRLVVLAAVAVELIPVCDAVVQLAVLGRVVKLLPLHALPVNHRSASATDPPAVAGLLLEGHVIWGRAKPDPRIATGLDLSVHALYSHGISLVIRNRRWRSGQLRLGKDRTEI